MSQISAILIGANSGLSQALAVKLSQKGVRLGLMAAEPEALKPLVEKLGDDTLLTGVDIRDAQASRAAFDTLWQQLDGAALVVINTSATGLDLTLPFELDQQINDVNVAGFTALANAAFVRMTEQKYGQLAALTSIAGERGGPRVAFHASKGYQQRYLEGLRLHAQRLKLPITVTDLRLGYLDKLQSSKRFGASLDKLASQMERALAKAKPVAYITRRWYLISWIARLLPDFIYNKRKYK